MNELRTSRRRSASELLDRLGPELYRLATVLTADADFAERLVISAIGDHCPNDSPQSDLRNLSAAIFLEWTRRDLPAIAPKRSGRLRRPAATPDDLTLDELHALPEDQLGALALCKFGAHSYRRAAELLGIPATELASILCAALRSLDRPTTGLNVRPSAA